MYFRIVSDRLLHFFDRKRGDFDRELAVDPGRESEGDSGDEAENVRFGDLEAVDRRGVEVEAGEVLREAGLEEPDGFAALLESVLGDDLNGGVDLILKRHDLPPPQDSGDPIPSSLLFAESVLSLTDHRKPLFFRPITRDEDLLELGSVERSLSRVGGFLRFARDSVEAGGFFLFALGGFGGFLFLRGGCKKVVGVAKSVEVRVLGVRSVVDCGDKNVKLFVGHHLNI